MSVFVIEGERGAPAAKRETARGFLMKGQRESSGYGLYSYFLLGSPPTDSSRARYLKAIQAYLSLIPTVSDLEDYVSADKLNITYFPVKSPLPPNPTAEWLLDNYDFARARVLLDVLPGAHNAGPLLCFGFETALRSGTVAGSIPVPEPLGRTGRTARPDLVVGSGVHESGRTGALLGAADGRVADSQTSFHHQRAGRRLAGSQEAARQLGRLDRVSLGPESGAVSVSPASPGEW